MNPTTARFFAASHELAAAMYRLSAEVRDRDRRKADMSLTGYEPGAIQARLDALKKNATARRQVALGKLDAADAKVASVDAAIERVAVQIEKEADDALQEFATHTNGGPLLVGTENETTVEVPNGDEKKI